MPEGAAAGSAPAASVADAIGYVVSCVLVGVALAFAAAWLWAKLADPPTAPLTNQGLYLGETQLNQQSETTLWLLVVGFGFGLVAGLVVGWRGQRHGVVTVAAVVAMCVVAAGLTAVLGISVFGPDGRAQVAGAAVGAQITSDLSVGSPLVLLGWPIGGLVGTCLAILRWPAAPKDSPPVPPSSNLAAQHSPTRGS